MKDVEIKLISNGLDGEGVYSALCGSLVRVSDPLRKKALCMAYLAFVFGNDYCAGMNQLYKTEEYAGNNLPPELQQTLQNEMLNAAAGISYTDALSQSTVDLVGK